MRKAGLVPAVLVGLAACAQADEQGVNQGEPQAEAVAPKAAATGAKKVAARGTDLSAYVGKYPYDAVAGHRFFDHPAVRAAIAAAVPDKKLASGIRAGDGVNVPIVEVNGRILAWGGARRAEDRYNWAVAIAPDGTKPEICIYDGVGYDGDFQSSQWFEPGRPSIMKQGKCPSSREDYPPAAIAAG